jgi:tetratricopeptide (TPR) repeat protein
MARGAGVPDIHGLAALNLGTLIQRRGEFARASELFAQSMTSFAGVKNSEYQLSALFNMAHCEREQGLWESAAELYVSTLALAERIGHRDLEIGSMAGAGLCYLELGLTEKGAEAAGEVRSRLQKRPEWFQNRELAEALMIRARGPGEIGVTAFEEFERAVESAGTADKYPHIWLVLACAPTLLEAEAGRARKLIDATLPKAIEFGFTELAKRFESLASADSTTREATST